MHARGQSVEFRLDGDAVALDDDGGSLLDALRERLGRHQVKDGCSPQGQCGCCTVLVDGAPRVACVTPLRRVQGREVTTVDGLDPARRAALVEAFDAAGASQCGFCTPGILCRLAALDPSAGVDAAERALRAHLCRCTGWRTILDAWAAASPAPPGGTGPDRSGGVRARDRQAATRRATIEGGTAQVVGPDAILGRAGFAADTAPTDALVAVPDAAGGWSVAETLAEARAGAGTVGGRRSGAAVRPPLALPDGEWAATLRTSWVEPAYLELDASWCAPGGEPASPLANGGAFGGKADAAVARAARQLADRYGRTVRVVLRREDIAARGPKRPPVAGGALPDGTGVLRMARTPGVAERVAEVAPGLRVEQVDVAGPPTSAAIRAAGWAEAVVLLAGAAGVAPRVREPGQGAAEALIDADGTVVVRVWPGAVLDEVVVRSYVTGAAHMALSWIASEGLAVDDDGTVNDLTVRSFGVLGAGAMPPVRVEVADDAGAPRRCSDAAMVAVAAAAWLHVGCPTDWPCGARWR